MNIKEIKTKIYALLGVPAVEDESALLAMLDSTARKLAVYAKCIKRSAELRFSAVNGVCTAELPADFASFAFVRSGRRIWVREHFEISAGKIKTAAPLAGACELIYYAYPPAVNGETAEETELFADGFICDTAAYGAAMELCSAFYPTDVQKYMRLATEYDERMANLITSAGEGTRVANLFFAGRGGVLI